MTGWQADHGKAAGDVIKYLQLLNNWPRSESVEKRIDGASLPDAAGWRRPKCAAVIEVREDLSRQPPKKVIELSSLTPSLSAYDGLLKAPRLWPMSADTLEMLFSRVPPAHDGRGGLVRW